MRIQTSPVPERKMTDAGFRRSVVLAAFGCLYAAGIADAIEIKTERWGFNGRVALNRFNVLSVLVDNPTPQHFEGTIRLRKKLGDAEIVEAVSVAPFTSKWVQFYPYITGWGNQAHDEWQLFYGRGQSHEMDPPRVAKYQRVILDDMTGLSSRGGVLKEMPENFFPAFVSATDALQVVGMEREPRSWIPSQKQAFLDWLHLGGTLVLFHGSTGKFPEFSGPLATLNSPLDERNFGAGRIVKVPLTQNRFTLDEARQVFVDLPRNVVQTNEKIEDLIDTVDPSIGNDASTNQFSEGADPFVASSFLGQLKEMTKPDHNWLLLHFMFWVYIAMVFPGCYILGKRWSDFRVVYAGLLGTVVLFSFLFSIVGQRGYGEATAVHTVAIARSLPDGGLDVAGWSNVFVTGGADYTIKHNGIGALYSACSEHERVNGVINNGMEGTFVVDIPPFSNREFATRIKFATGSPKVTVDDFNVADDRLTDLVLSVDGLNPSDSQSAYVLSGNRFYSLRWIGNKLKFSMDSGDASAMLKVQSQQNWSNTRNYGYGYEQNQTPQQRFQQMFSPLLSRSLNVSRETEATQVRLRADTIRVYVYSRMPAEFAIQNPKLGAQSGQVLYCVDLQLPEQ